MNLEEVFALPVKWWAWQAVVWERKVPEWLQSVVDFFEGRFREMTVTQQRCVERSLSLKEPYITHLSPWWVVVFAQTELVVALVIGCDLYCYVHCGAGSVLLHDCSSCVQTTSFVFQRTLIGITTQAAQPSLVPPLVLKMFRSRTLQKVRFFHGKKGGLVQVIKKGAAFSNTHTEAATVEPIVIVIVRCSKPNSPSSAPAGWFKQAAVTCKIRTIVAPVNFTQRKRFHQVFWGTFLTTEAAQIQFLTATGNRNNFSSME